MTTGRAKLFIENILIYGLGSAMNMVIPFIMLPIITRLLPSADFYGINDTVVIFVSIGSAIVMMGMYDAMYRFFFDKEDEKYRKEVCSTTLFTLLITGSIVLVIVSFIRQPLAALLFSNIQYASLIVVGGLNIWFTSINTIVAAPTRMRNQRVRYITIQTLAPIISYSCAIILILNGEYVYALPLASLFANIAVCIIFTAFNWKNFSLKSFNRAILKPMLKFGVPLMPVFIFFWIISSVGRIVITNTWGLEYTGIYAAAAKLAAVSQLIYSAFSGGWQYFAFSTMNDEDYIELISRVFDYLSGLTFFATALLVIVLKPIYTIILPAQYVDGIIIVPALFLAPLILMLRQTIGMHFQVKKLTLLGTSTIGFGAIVAVLLYYLLIPAFGIAGAAVASLAGYVASLLITIIILNKMRLILIPERIYIGSLMTAIVLTLYMSSASTFLVYVVAAVECIILVIVYRDNLGDLVSRMLHNRAGNTSIF